MQSTTALTLAVILFVLTVPVHGDEFMPARLRSGAPPALPALATGGGEVLLEVGISEGGAVTQVTPLRIALPFDEMLASAVREWRWHPAVEITAPDGARGPREHAGLTASKVLVAGLFRPPSFGSETFGVPPRDVAQPSSDVPYPIEMIAPNYPPAAFGSGVVLVEALVDETGRPIDVSVVHPAPPFDEPAVAAVRAWRFRPASTPEGPRRAYVYVVMGFLSPVVPTAR